MKSEEPEYCATDAVCGARTHIDKMLLALERLVRVLEFNSELIGETVNASENAPAYKAWDRVLKELIQIEKLR